MSEHPELREALAESIAAVIGWPDIDGELNFDLADALLAGPVGKLQADLMAMIARAADAESKVVTLEHRLADPERIRRAAIGARLIEIGRNPHWSAQGAITSALAAGESAVTGKPTCATCGGSGWQVLDDGPGDREVWRCPACEGRRAVTGEAT